MLDDVAHCIEEEFIGPFPVDAAASSISKSLLLSPINPPLPQFGSSVPVWTTPADDGAVGMVVGLRGEHDLPSAPPTALVRPQLNAAGEGLRSWQI